jgi:hypothetical protein
MSFTRLIGAGLAAVFSAYAAAEDFALDMTDAEIRKALDLFVVQDLAVGESGYLSLGLFCSHNGNLYLSGDEMLANKRPTASGTSVRREPDSRLSVVVQEDDGLSLSSVSTIIRGAARRDCAKMPIQPEVLFRISTINGKSKASDLIGPK